MVHTTGHKSNKGKTFREMQPAAPTEPPFGACAASPNFQAVDVTLTEPHLVPETMVVLFEGKLGAVPNLYRMPDVEYIDSLMSGVAPTVIFSMADQMKTTRRQLQDYLQLSSTTIERRKSKSANLDLYQSERLVGLKRLIDQVQAMVEDSGDPTGFDAAEWLGRWIEKPLPALAGKKPAEYLSTVSGQKLLSNILNQMLNGAYA